MTPDSDENTSDIMSHVRQLTLSLHQAMRDEQDADFRYFDRQLSDVAAEHHQVLVVQAAIKGAFDYPFDKGIPRFHSPRWLAMRCQPRPEDLPTALKTREILPSDLNRDERRSLGVYATKEQLERFGQ